MPVTSKQQFRFMAAVASGKIRRKGLGKTKAREFITATGSYKRLPERKR